MNNKSVTTGRLLALFLGGLGVHHFYVGQYKRGIFYLLFCWTYVPIFLGWIDILFMKKWIQQENTKGGFKTMDDEFQVPFSQQQEHKQISTNPVRETMSGGGLVYDEQLIILPQYSHLKTPTRILQNIESLKNPQKKTRQGNGYSISISVTSTSSEFFMDSFKYSKKSGRPCEHVPLMEYWTTFSILNTEQKNWYFYWREQSLKGNFLDTDLSYIILFTYELLNYSFNPNAAFNVSMLERLYENYKDREPKVANYLPKWTEDMLMELGEEEMVRQRERNTTPRHPLYEQIIKHQSDLSKISFSQWKGYVTNYRETDFFVKNKNKIYKVFKGSIPILEQMYRETGTSILDEWFEMRESEMRRYMFSSAVLARETIEVMTPYISHRNKEKLALDITNLFRLSENVTRSIMGEKRQIKVDENALPEGIRERMVDAFSMNSKDGANSRFVKVQSGTKSEGGSLIPKRPVEEIEKPVPAFSLDLQAVEEAKKANEEFGNLYREHYGEDEVVEEVAVAQEDTMVTQEETQEKIEEVFMTVSADEGAFIEDLVDFEIELLCMFADGSKEVTEINRFAKAKGTSASVIVTAINEKAIEHLGDNLLEQDGNEYVIMEEYNGLLGALRGEESK